MIDTQKIEFFRRCSLRVRRRKRYGQRDEHNRVALLPIIRRKSVLGSQLYPEVYGRC